MYKQIIFIFLFLFNFDCKISLYPPHAKKPILDFNVDITKIFDSNGDIQSGYVKKYYTYLKPSLINYKEVDQTILLPPDIEKLFIKTLPISKYKDYITNITVKNYFLIQSIPESGIYYISVPKTTYSEEGKLLWKIGLDFLIQKKGKKLIFNSFHESSFSRLIDISNLYQYIYIDSNFGMNYTEIHLLLLDKNNISNIHLNKIIFSSGSFVPSTILKWEIKNNNIMLDGFIENKDKKIEKYTKEIQIDNI